MTAFDDEVRAALEHERQARVNAMKRQAERQLAILLSHGKTRVGDVYQAACLRLFEENDERLMAFVSAMRRVPVSIQEFLESPDFLGGVDMEVWPQIRRDVIDVNPDIITGAAQVVEYVDSGATGTGKTTKASITHAYQVYLLHCIENPQRLYGLAAHTPIVLSMTSSNWNTTRDVLFRPFYTIVQNMPFFRRFTNWNKDKSSVIEFDNRLVVEPVIADKQGIIGRAIVGGHIDEANYMTVTEGSARAEQHKGGLYDQAEEFYRAIKLRRRSRFSSRLPVPGVIVLSSSTRYTDDFLDRRIAEVRESGEPGVKIFRHKQYEVQPAERFSPERFRLLVGTPEYPTRILKDGEVRGVDFPENGVVEEVPEDYRYEFTHRPEDALRDVCGISTINLTPFITQRAKITEARDRWKAAGNAHPVRRPNVILLEHGMPSLIPEILDADMETPRFVHIDLSKTKDRCGIAMVRIDRMVSVPVEGGVFEHAPYYVVELAVSIQPSQAAELDIAEVRNWVAALKTVHQVPIYMVTYDGFASAESVQTLRRTGIRSEVISMDRTDEPYQMLRRALYQDRIELADNDLLLRELTHLERDEKNGRVDHPPKGSKDVADAVAGAIYAATTSRPYRTKLYYTDASGKRITPPGR